MVLFSGSVILFFFYFFHSGERDFVLEGIEEVHESSYHEVPVGEFDTR